MRLRSLGRRIRRLVGAAALSTAFVVPVYLFVHAEKPAAPSRLDPPALAPGAVPTVSVPGYRDAVPVLVYHDISGRAGRYTVSPRSFAEQMAALHASGFHAITAAQLLDFVHGRGMLPQRPVLITFDDGLGSAWRVADPIIQRYGMHAISFVISGQIGRHGYYYMHPQELRSMIRSGRWDVEAHTRLSHQYVPSDDLGGAGPALTNREWLPRLRRLETKHEFEARIGRDLERNVAELRSYGARPLLFAYPFSAARTPTNDVALIPILRRLVASSFQASFVDADGGRFLDRYDGATAQELPRIEVYRTTTATELLTRLRDLAPSAPVVHDALASERLWSFEGSPAVGARPTVADDRLTLGSPARHWVAAYLGASQSELWQRYRVGVTMRRLSHEGSGTSETLLVGASGSDRYAVTVSAAHVRVLYFHANGSQRELSASSIRASSSHRLSVALDAARLRVSVDGRSVARLAVAAGTHGGIALGAWRAYAHSPIAELDGVSVTPLA
jgi:poly-beta-1,6-N-acetyl-D-glucosamine N-deacetylase